MNQCITRVTKSFLLLLFAALLLASCVPQKQIKYLQKEQEKDTSSFSPNKLKSDYRIQFKDNLYIRVYALDEKANTFFNKLGGTSSFNDYANDASVYLNSYTVNSDGNIEFPVVGLVPVRGLTAEQAKTVLEGKIGEYLKETTVVVKLVNFKVAVLGEINRPGEFTLYQEKVNVFEALSLAGDMTEFSNRKKVALIRQEAGGSRVHYIDLTSVNVLSSPYYYLQPNDIIYISPLGYKRWGLGSTFPWAMVLASVSTTLLLINYFK
jgi:polysaccharide export outer membrane protein